MSARIRKPNKTGTWRYLTDNPKKSKLNKKRSSHVWNQREARSVLPITFYKGAFWELAEWKVYRKRKNLLQQIFPVSLFTSGQCKKTTKLKN